MGRLLRPRPSAARARRPLEPGPEPGLRADGVPDPGRAISPYARGRRPGRGGHHGREFRVDHGVYGHESILKLISYRFGLGDLTTRMRFARNIGQSFEWRHPDFEAPALPDPPEIVTSPCALGGGDVLDSQEAHASDLEDIEHVAERVGAPVYDGKLGDIFALPDTVARAAAARPR